MRLFTHYHIFVKRAWCRHHCCSVASGLVYATKKWRLNHVSEISCRYMSQTFALWRNKSSLNNKKIVNEIARKLLSETENVLHGIECVHSESLEPRHLPMASLHNLYFKEYSRSNVNVRATRCITSTPVQLLVDNIISFFYFPAISNGFTQPWLHFFLLTISFLDGAWNKKTFFSGPAGLLNSLI